MFTVFGVWVRSGAGWFGPRSSGEWFSLNFVRLIFDASLHKLFFSFIKLVLYIIILAHLHLLLAQEAVGRALILK